jgi:2-phosphosulfolactate phosphatase
VNYAVLCWRADSFPAFWLLGIREPAGRASAPAAEKSEPGHFPELVVPGRVAVARARRPPYDLRMSRPIFVHLIPALFEPADLQGGIAVVIDVLRATSTIIHALAAGAVAVVPCGEIEEARRVAADAPSGTVLLGGERKGLKIPGFDLGNSPDEYTRRVVAGKKIVMTTTNGTRALLRARQARRILIGALSNASAVVERLAAEIGPAHLICAGTEGKITLEDVLCAGGIAHWLDLAAKDAFPADDPTRLAMILFESCGRDYDRVHEDRVLATLRQSQGGQNLIECGLEADIVTCAEQDKFAIVPELFVDEWEIRVARD